METINDLYNDFVTLCGMAAPTRTRDEVQDKFHALGYSNYGKDGDEFIRRSLQNCLNPWPWGGEWVE